MSTIVGTNIEVTNIKFDSDTTSMIISSTGQITAQGEGSATTNLQQGLAKLWAAYDQRGDVLGGAGTSGDTFNTSSIVDVLEGHLDVSFSNNMANATYSMCATTHYSGTLAYDEYSRYCGGSNMAAGTFRLASQYSNGNEQDCYWNGILVHGDLA